MMDGIIYKTQPYLEHARLLFTYTQKGKVTLIAQGAQKLNSAYRVLGQYLTLISYTEQPDKSMHTLREGKMKDDFQFIKADFQKLKDAALMLEIVDRLIYEDLDHRSIYKHLVDALKADQIAISSLSFAIKMLSFLGYGIQMIPDGRSIKGVHIDTGGLIYDNDSKSPDLDVKSSTVLLRLMYEPYEKLTGIDLDIIREIKVFTLKYYQYHLQTTLKSLQ